MENAKQEIARLVEKYDKLKAENRIKDYNEAQTLSGFIEPLFMHLGWDVHDLEEVTPEDKNTKGRVDRVFRINRIPKFFLEAKPMKADLDIESYARQAINYSWNKGVAYAVLTDFESIKVFNAQAQSRLLSDKLIFEITCKEYISDFERLWLLSKNSFEENALDKYAEKYGKKIKKQTVNEKLFDDLKKAREMLTKSFGIWNKKVDKENLDEGVQRILDRLIFIRVLEDRELEPPMLKEIAHNWEKDRSGNKQLFPMLTAKFRELDDTYNSNLFDEHSCEKWEEYDDAVKKVILMLYGTDVYGYDFKEIPADILGGVYENYLGYIAQNPIKIDAKGKAGKLFEFEGKKEIKEKSRKKRKEQGIYYTPKFIVDYIVKNTLGEKLKEARGMPDLKKIKVLDPACGSGSFLTKALETIHDKYKNFSNPGGQAVKSEILLNNIYGVDLDPQAVELAKLNLLIDALDEKAKLPNLTENIRVGNSLISGTEKELQKYFGKNWQNKKPFNWEEKFPEVFAQGGFDVIIGNPPYVVLEGENIDLNYFKNNFTASRGGKINLYKLFIEKAINLLKEGGYLGFICPSNYISSADSFKLRKFIIENTKIIEIIEYTEKDKIFANVAQALTTIILQKTKQNQENKVHIITEKYGDNRGKQSDFFKNNNLEFVYINKIIEKIKRNKFTISDIAECFQGEINVSTKKELFSEDKKDDYLPLLRGNLIKNYKLIDNPKEYCPTSIDSRKHFKKTRVVFQEVSNQQQKRRVRATVVNSMLCGHTTNYCFSKTKDVDIFYVLALLNSELLNYYFSFFNKTNHVPVGEIKKIPIPNVLKDKRKEISELAKKITEFNKQLRSIPENSEKWNSVKTEIEKTDKEIDRKVYELYGLTEEEIKIVEGK